MRRVETPRVVPAQAEYVEQDVKYVCDVPGCGYSTSDEDDAEKHHGREHAAKGSTYVGDTQVHRFETEDDFKAWGRHSFYNRFYGKWKGAGWYAEATGTEPCGRGCCSDSYVQLTHIDDHENDVKERLSSVIGELRQLRALRRKETP
jgi:hypothetical protein